MFRCEQIKINSKNAVADILKQPYFVIIITHPIYIRTNAFYFIKSCPDISTTSDRPNFFATSIIDFAFY